MNNTHALGSTKSWSRRASLVAAGAVAIVVGGMAVQANAATPSLAAYDETDSPNPLEVTNGLVYYTAADMGWVVGAPIADVDSLSYTVESGTTTVFDSHGVASGPGYAPSYQLVVDATIGGAAHKYARVTWEPYLQTGLGLNPEKGVYTDLEDGLWWTSKIPYGNVGSMTNPQPLSFFENGGGAGWGNVVVGAVAVHQGTSSAVSSVVTKVTYNGTSIPLGNADSTLFNQADIDSAVASATAPLNDQIAALTADLADANSTISDLQGQLSDALSDVSDLQAALTLKQNQLATAQTQLANAQTELAEAQSDLGDANSDNADLIAQSAALLDEVADLQDEVNGLTDDLEDAQDAAALLQTQLDSANANLATAQTNVTTSQSSLVATQAALVTATTNLAAAQAALTAYQNTHHTADGSSIGTSRAVLSGTPVHGHTARVVLLGTIATKATGVKYQWYLSGKAVTGATKSTYKVPSSAKGKSVSVKVTGTYKFVTFGVQSNSLAAK